MINTLAFSLRSLRRDWRSGELRILAIAVVIAVASMTAVGFFTDRARQAMGQQAGELLAADLVLTSSNPIGSDRIAYARTSALRTAQTLNFRSVVIADDKMQLVEVKAVSADYPLRGSLRIAPERFVPDGTTSLTPARGEVWVNADLLQKLNVHVGDVINLGEAGFSIAKVLTYEPDRGGELFNIAPRVMMNIEDVPSTQLLQPGSRARHMLLVAGIDDGVRAYRAWLISRLNPNERLVTLEDGRPELRAALERAQRFLGLASLVSVFLAGVAMAMAARRYTQRHLDTSAIMRCLGATQRTIIKIFTWEMFWIGLAASLIGCLVGYVAQTGLALILAGLVATELPLPSLRPALVGLPLGLAVLMGFALPPLLALKHVPPTRVLRRQATTPVPRNMATYALAFLTMTGLISWHARDLELLAYVLGGAVGTVMVLGITAYLLVKLLNGLRGRVGVAWRFGFANISRRARVSAAQIVAFGLGIMVLLLLSLVRGDLLEGWRQTIP
ncbi:MAG: ABC transporter permease, partial [Acidiferrobacterales bacterium]